MKNMKKSIAVLQNSLNTFKDETDQKLIELHEEVAGVKNYLKHQKDYKGKILNDIHEAVSSAKLQMEKSLNDYLDSSKPEKPPKYKSSTIENMQKLREKYDSRLIENEKYIQSLKQHTQEIRSKSSSRGYSDLVADNKKMRIDISNLWEKP